MCFQVESYGAEEDGEGRTRHEDAEERGGEERGEMGWTVGDDDDEEARTSSATSFDDHQTLSEDDDDLNAGDYTTSPVERPHTTLSDRDPELGALSARYIQGRSDWGYIGIYTSPKSVLQIFMWLLVVFF